MNSTYIKIVQQLLNNQLLISADVGAANGILDHWFKLFGNSKILCFEPHKVSFEQLKGMYSDHPFRDFISFENRALGSKPETREFYLHNAATGSSFYEPDHFDDDVSGSSYYYPLRVETVETYTLSQILKDQNYDRLDLIKLDVQGAELEILKGLNDLELDRLLAIEVEVPLNSAKGTNLCDLEEFLKQRQFTIFDVKVNRTPRNIPSESISYQEKYLNVARASASVAQRAYEFDMVYFKAPKTIISFEDENLLRRYIYVLTFYNFYGDALYTIDLAQKSSFYKTCNFEELRGLVKALHELNLKTLDSYQSTINTLNGMVYSQYMWQPFPSS